MIHLVIMGRVAYAPMVTVKILGYHLDVTALKGYMDFFALMTDIQMILTGPDRSQHAITSAVRCCAVKS